MALELLDEKKKLQSLKQFLHQFSAPAAEALIERKENGDIQCFACGHRCIVKPGRDGVCRVRFNENGVLQVPHSYVGVLACDPIEKKPFWHVLPGSDALTFGMSVESCPAVDYDRLSPPSATNVRDPQPAPGLRRPPEAP